MGIKARLETFHNATTPVTEYYDAIGKLYTINAERSPDEIFKDVEYAVDKTVLQDPKVLFIVGGPGCGKGTQCERLVNAFGLSHLSSGDLLRDEVASGSALGKSLEEAMKNGQLVGLETVLTLIRNAMVKLTLKNSKGFLIDGYPREIRQGTLFESTVKPCDAVVYFKAKDATMTKRLMHRGKTSGRVDDNEETIKKRLVTFHESTQPVVDHYKVKKMLIEIPADGEVDDITMEALDKVGKIFSPPPADIYDRVNHAWLTVPRKIYLKVKHFYDNDTTYIYDRVNDCPMPVSWHNYCKVKHLYKDCKLDVCPRPGDDTLYVTTHYDKQRKLHKINAEREPEAIFGDVEKSLDSIILSECKVLFVVGGPVSGKGTQCQRLVNKFNLTHICSGDLLRDEVASGSKLGKSLALTMKKGDLVGLETVLTLIRNAMVKAALAGSDGFLIDGYPREVKQGAVFESMIKPCDGCVYFNCCDETMVERLLKRAQVDGVDDDEAKIRKRLAIFHNSTQPVVDHFKEKGKLIEVIAEGDVDEIYADGVVELAPVFDL